MKANEDASCTMGPILISLLWLLPGYYRKSLAQSETVIRMYDVGQSGSIALSESTVWENGPT